MTDTLGIDDMRKVAFLFGVLVWVGSIFVTVAYENAIPTIIGSIFMLTMGALFGRKMTPAEQKDWAARPAERYLNSAAWNTRAVHIHMEAPALRLEAVADRRSAQQVPCGTCKRFDDADAASRRNPGGAGRFCVLRASPGLAVVPLRPAPGSSAKRKSASAQVFPYEYETL